MRKQKLLEVRALCSHPGRAPDSWSCGLSTVATTELLPIQRLRLGSAQRTAALSEPKAGLRNPSQQSQPCHRRNRPEPHCLLTTQAGFSLRDQGPQPRHRKRGGPRIQTQSHTGFHASRFQKGLGCQGSWRVGREKTKGKVWAAQAFLSGLIKWFPDQG